MPSDSDVKRSGKTSKRNRFVGVFGVVLVGLAVAVLVCPTAQAKMTLKDKVDEKELKLQIYGFSQFEARGGEGWQISRNRNGDSLEFFAQRVRVGFNYFHGPIAGKLFLDFNQATDLGEAGGRGGLPRIIKDAFVAYKFDNAAFIRLGMIKTPLGLDFTVPGWNLDIIERNGLEKGLVLERDFGLMLSGRLIGQEGFEGKKQMETNGLEMGTERQGYGFGYDLGVFNPAGRSGAVTWLAPSSATQAGGDVRGEGLAYVGRVHFDYGKELHVEAAYGISEQAGGFIDDPNTSVTEKSEDYSVFDVGVASELMDQKLELKGEYISGTDIRGVKDREQTTFVVTAGYLFVPQAQFVVKHYSSEHEILSGSSVVETDLTNTYVGINIFPKRVSDKHRDLQRNKIVINYVIVGGDDEDASIPWQGLGGYRDSTWGLQWQYKY